MSKPDSRDNGGATNKLLVGILAATLGVGGIQGVEQFATTDSGDVLDRVKTVEDQTRAHGEALNRIDRVVDVRDANGVPLVYFPRELVRNQTEILATLKQIRDELQDRTP